MANMRDEGRKTKDESNVMFVHQGAAWATGASHVKRRWAVGKGRCGRRGARNRPPTTDHRPPIVALVSRLASLIFACLALSGCLLMSGARPSEDVTPSGGNVSNSFVSAEGSELRTLQIGGGAREIQVIGIVAVETGDLNLDLLKPDGSVVFTVGSKPGDQVTRSGSVLLDEQGRLKYQIHAVGARNGSYQILFQSS